ncbi:hypothetical protein F0A16_02710 [Salinicola corii]|uniref:Uncharacterized protein n=1 Tax=Salinicola corii TaxID=2606937 RepID=A0A640WJG3_9GAMM|nr:hypothetical protein [Salinicola corii]KAA0020717.1 hypothetical protein F0A16_02710 [Salinicola corii]
MKGVFLESTESLIQRKRRIYYSKWWDVPAFLCFFAAPVLMVSGWSLISGDLSAFTLISIAVSALPFLLLWLGQRGRREVDWHERYLHEQRYRRQQM